VLVEVEVGLDCGFGWEEVPTIAVTAFALAGEVRTGGLTVRIQDRVGSTTSGGTLSPALSVTALSDLLLVTVAKFRFSDDRQF